MTRRAVQWDQPFCGFCGQTLRSAQVCVHRDDWGIMALTYGCPSKSEYDKEQAKIREFAKRLTAKGKKHLLKGILR